LRMDGIWIECKNRLPEPNVDVLIFSETEREKGALIAYIPRGEKYFVGLDEWRYDYVTHWMPLPEPPVD